MSDCLFCKIIAGDIPSDKVYEDEYVFAFRDIAPQAPFNVLIVPKKHVKSATDINEENSVLMAKCFEAVNKIAAQEGVENFRLINNCGEAAGQTVPHIHFHMLSGMPLTEKMV